MCKKYYNRWLETFKTQSEFNFYVNSKKMIINLEFEKSLKAFAAFFLFYFGDNWQSLHQTISED